MLTGIESKHDNHKEDRLWKFQCGHLEWGHLTECKWTEQYINDYIKPLEFTVPDDHVIVGLQSIHDNKFEDRIWKVKTCHFYHQ